jgi:predicted transcriptional regulator
MHAVETATDRVINHGARGEIVISRDVSETFQSSSTYATEMERLKQTGRFDVFVYDGELPYALNQIDDTQQIIVAEGNDLRAMLETDSEEVVEWAESKYESYKQQSKKVT